MSNPIVTGLVSTCIYDYFKYMAGKKKSEYYEKEINLMKKNKTIIKSTKEVFAPCINDSDKVTIINVRKQGKWSTR